MSGHRARRQRGSLIEAAGGLRHVGGDLRGVVARSLLRDALEHGGLVPWSLEPVRPGGALWRAIGPSGAWSIRWAPRSEAAALAATARWLEHLVAVGIAVPSPWRASGAGVHLLVVDDGVALVTRWRRGTTVLELGWDEPRAEALGVLLAHVHGAAVGVRLPGARRYDAVWAASAWTRLGIDRAVPAATADERATVQAGLVKAVDVLDAAWHGGPGGPVVMVHADVHGGNVLEVGRMGDQVELALIDVDRAGLAPVALDLAFALLEHDEPTAWAMLRGYRRWRPLEEGFEHCFGAFRVLATADNLGYLAAFERDHDYVVSAWPALVAACAALAAGEPQAPLGMPAARASGARPASASHRDDRCRDA